MGRPTALTPEVHKAIVDMVRGGNFRATALRACGLSKNVIRNWEERGEKGEEPYAAFMHDLQQAEAESETELVSEIRNARPAIVGAQGPDLWQARAHLLERRFPNRWSARVRMTVDEELSALMKRLEAKLDEDTFAKVVHASREDAADEGASDQRH